MASESKDDGTAGESGAVFDDEIQKFVDDREALLRSLGERVYHALNVGMPFRDVLQRSYPVRVRGRFDNLVRDVALRTMIEQEVKHVFETKPSHPSFIPEADVDMHPYIEQVTRHDLEEYAAAFPELHERIQNKSTKETKENWDPVFRLVQQRLKAMTSLACRIIFAYVSGIIADISAETTAVSMAISFAIQRLETQEAQVKLIERIMHVACNELMVHFGFFVASVQVTRIRLTAVDSETEPTHQGRHMRVIFQLIRDANFESSADLKTYMQKMFEFVLVEVEKKNIKSAADFGFSKIEPVALSFKIAEVVEDDEEEEEEEVGEKGDDDAEVDDEDDGVYTSSAKRPKMRIPDDGSSWKMDSEYINHLDGLDLECELSRSIRSGASSGVASGGGGSSAASAAAGGAGGGPPPRFSERPGGFAWDRIR